MTFQDDINVGAGVAKASTSAALRSVLIGVVPILEFGLVIAIALLVVQLPLRLIRRN